MSDPWARPDRQQPPGEQPTRRIAAQPGSARQPAPPGQPGPPGRPGTGRPAGPPPPNTTGPDATTAFTSDPGATTAFAADPGATTAFTSDPGGSTPRRGRLSRLAHDPLSIVLVVVIVIALLAAGVVGAELYGRHRADSLVAAATACVVQDDVSVSFGSTPFLLQYFGKHYSDISITTAGNQLREAKGMKAQIDIDDVRLQDNGTSKGTIGSLAATISWTADGIKQTLQNSIPLVGSFITGIKTDKSAGTIELQGVLGSIVTKPVVADNGIALQVQQLSGLGFSLPREIVQPALDSFSAQLTKNYPLNVHADSVEVSDTGVVAKFSTRNAAIPAGNQDPCFAGL